MTTDEVLEEIKDRGLTVVLRDDGTLCLRGPKSEATPELLAVLRWHREAIAARLGTAAVPPPPPEPAEPDAYDPDAWMGPSWSDRPFGREGWADTCGYVRLARWEDHEPPTP